MGRYEDLRKSMSHKARHQAKDKAVRMRRWWVKRKKPYTEIGIARCECIRCGAQAEYQWQICADGNNYRPLCSQCDIGLNKTVLKFMRHPHALQLAAEYKERD